LVAPNRVQSPVSLSIFRVFIAALEGNAMNITDTNFRERQRLCEESGFSEIAMKLSEFHPSMDFKEAEDAILQDKVTQLSTDFVRLGGEVAALRSATARIQTLLEQIPALKAQIGQKLNDPVVEQLSTDFS
jgi:hypothetical protein